MTRARNDGSGFRSSLAAYAPMMREADPSNGRSAAAKIWHETGLAVFNPEHMSSWSDRKLVENMAEQMYGKRKG